MITRCAHRLPAVLLLGLLVPLIAGSGLAARPAPAVRAQPAPAGAYVLSGTWEGLKDAIPPDAWRHPAGIAIDTERRIYVTDAADGRVTVLDPDGGARLLVSSSSGLLTAPTHIAADAARDRLYVSDPGAGALVVLRLDGSPLRSHAGIADPAGVGVGPDGTVYVGSAESGLVHPFTAEGDALPTFSGVGPLDPDATYGDLLGGLDVDADGQVFVLDGRSPKVRVFDAAGDLRDTFNPPEMPTDVAIDYDPSLSPQRRYWFSTARGILRYDPRRDFWEDRRSAPVAALDVDSWVGTAMALPSETGGASQVHLLAYNALRTGSPTRWGGPLLIPGILDGPQGIEAGADGRLYVLDLGPRVQRYGSDGVVVDQLEQTDPLDADADAEGTLFVMQGSGVRAVPAGAPAGRTGWYAGLGDPMALAVGPRSEQAEPGEEALHVLGADGTLRALSPADGSRLGEALLETITEEKAFWADLALDPEGYAYALDRRGPAITVRAPDGAQSAFRLPRRGRRIAATPDGHVLLLDRDGWVRRFTRAGDPAGAFDATRFDLAVASSPSDLTVDAAGRVYVTDRKADLISLYDWDAAAMPQEPPDDSTTCRAYPDKTASPPEIWIGETVDVSLTARGGCGSDVLTEPLDIVLIIDESGSMNGEKIRTTREAAMDFVEEVDLSVSQVGVVGFNTAARLRSPMIQDEDRLRRAIQRLSASGGTNIAVALARARQEMRLRGRPEEARPIFVLLSDGYNNAGHAPVLSEATKAKREGIEIFTIGIQADVQLMTQVASGEDHYFGPRSARFLYGIFDAIAQQISTSLLFRSLTVIDRIPENMRYVQGSAQPPASYDPDAHSLTWTLTNVPFTGFGLRYTLEPLEIGLWPTNVVAWGEGRDGHGREARIDFPVPVVRVIGPSPTPTPSASPTPTPTPTVTPSPTPEPRPIYLPIALREQCTPDQRYADVVLVLDTSSSMTGAKLAAAKAAALRFVEAMELDPGRPGDVPGSQVAVVAFDTTARLEAPLSNDPAVLEAAIQALEPVPGTYIDRGLRAAADELAGPGHRAGHTPVILLLTDGLQTGDPAPAYAVAEEARDAGALIYAVGLGADVDLAFLEIVSGDAARLYQALQPEDLAEIYARIAGEIPCPADAFWGGRVR